MFLELNFMEAARAQDMPEADGSVGDFMGKIAMDYRTAERRVTVGQLENDSSALARCSKISKAVIRP